MRNKKIAVGLFMVMVLALGSVLGVVANDSVTSDGEIEFVIDPDIIRPPYDPEIPGDLLPPDDGHSVQAPGGPLHLQVVPVFNFGRHILEADMPTSFNHIPPSNPNRAHIVMVWDHRHITADSTGIPTGWSVFAEKTTQFVHANGTNVLRGAEIRFSQTRTSGTGGLGGSIAPSNLGGADSLSFNPTVGEGNRVFIGGALATEGGWNTHVAFGKTPEDILLHIPADANMVLGKYTADVVWTLSTSGPVMGE